MNTLGKKGGRKIPQSVKTQRKIDAAVRENTDQIKRVYHGMLNRREKHHKDEIEQLKQSFVLPVPDATQSIGAVVPNWKSGWKWFSNIAFALIVAVQAFYDSLPPELIATLPADTQSSITATLAILGLLGRFINQSKPKPLPAVENHDV